MVSFVKRNWGYLLIGAIGLASFHHAMVKDDAKLCASEVTAYAACSN